MFYAIKRAEDNFIVDVIEAHNERAALCRFIERHDELEDVMLWKPPICSYPRCWRVAVYDCEDDYLYAEPYIDDVAISTTRDHIDLILEQQGGII
jgi:hypothetical protein